ncbi:MAG: NAD-dependent epimerase/dehydratase family protein [Micromonosporaceae bacterium]|nr:NAD-dependent epimerase/dehydratase family protein [Micromonosporaceae bacterium]
MRILVTGAAGFIGSHVGHELSAAGHEVSGLDCLHPSVHPMAGAPGSGDIRDPVAVRSALRGIDAVVHHAALVGLGLSTADIPEYVSCNDLGTAVLLAGMAEAGVRRLVLASSMVIYGEGRYACDRHGTVRPGPRRVADLDAGRFEPPCPHCGQPLAAQLVPEDAPADPRSVYAATKLAQEHLCAAWARQTGSRVVALRYHNVYGPRMPRDTPYAGVASLFRSALERGQPPRVFEDGRQRRDFVHVHDVARANLAALRATGDAADRAGFTAYNICSGEPHTVGEMAAALATAYGGAQPVCTGEYRLGDVRHVVADPALARAELGFAARVPFAEGVSEFARAPLRV